MDFRKDQPSVKLHHAPGGQSNFSLGWGNEEPTQQPKNQVQATVQTQQQPTQEVKVQNQQQSSSVWSHQEEEKKESVGATTSVKVHHAPGGQSNFSLGWSGDDNSSQ